MDDGLAVTVVVGVFVIVVLGLQWRRGRARRAEAASKPIDRSGPSYDRAGDAYVRDQIAGLLATDERVTHIAPCGYVPTGTLAALAGPTSLVGAALRKGCLVTVTDRRVILVMTRAGAFGPLLENQGTKIFDREQLVGSVGRAGERRLAFEVRGPTAIVLEYQRSKQFGNVEAFWRDVPRILEEWTGARAS